MVLSYKISGTMDSIYERFCSSSQIAYKRAAALKKELYSIKEVRSAEVASSSEETEVKVASCIEEFFHEATSKAKMASSLVGRVAFLAVLYVPLLNIIASRAWELLDPQSAFLAQHMSRLNFSSKKVRYSDFPKHFWSLKTLPNGVLFPEVEILDFQYCGLQGLPSWLGVVFPNLVHLNLSHSKIGTIPESVIDLIKLRVLVLNNCDLDGLPDWFGKVFSNLSCLDLSRNSIKTLPSSMKKLVHLQTLILNSCELLELPDWFGDVFSSLIYLSLTFNKITSIPDSMRKLTQLQVLNLRGCKLLELPEWFGDAFLSLVKLNLSDNNIKVLPESMKNLTQLQKLDLQYCGLSRIYEWFGPTFSHLLELDFTGNSIGGLPQSILSLSQIQILKLKNCGLSELPSQFGEGFSNLKEINLKSNQIATIPEGFRSLKSTQINLEQNHITVGEITRIRAENLIDESVQLRYSIYEGSLEEGLVRFKTFTDCLGDLEQKAKGVKVLQELVDTLQNTEGFSDNFLAFYNKLFDSKLYAGSGNVEAKTAETLWEMLLFASKNEAFLQHFSNLLGQASTSCGDRVSYYFDLSYILYQCYKIQDKTWTEELKNLFVGFARFHLLFKEAENIILGMSIVDPLEIHLALLVKLKENLSLPIFSEEMLYFSLTDLTSEELKSVEGKVMEQTKDITRTLALNEEFENYFLQRFYLEELQSIPTKSRDQLYLEALWGICSEDPHFPKATHKLNSAQHKRVSDRAMLKYNLQKVPLIQQIVSHSSDL